MKFVPVKVKCYSGYKAEEHPVSFVQNGKETVIEEITDRWYQGETNPEFPPADYFRVNTSDEQKLILKHDLRADRWYLFIQD